MNIAIFGLGYVGSVSAGCLSEAGHQVVGVDIHPDKVERINRGESPIVEAGLERLIREGQRAGRLRATTDAAEAVRDTTMCWLCVSTPSRPDGSLDTQYLERVCEEVGAALRDRGERYEVVVRSTALPGTTEDLLVPILERASGLVAGRDFGVCFHPELLREGVAVEDFRHPPKIVIGCADEASGDALAVLYVGFDAPLLRTEIRVAEMVKYTDNVWHALKIGFANEIGTLARAFGIDGRDVMGVFCQDRKLNISDAYLRPAFAFGGSCLPKDLRAIVHRAEEVEVELPILQSVLPSNAQHVDRALELITQTGNQRVGLLGLSFKAGTDDLRESPLVTVAERLIDGGFDIRIFDHNVNLSHLMGTNRDYIRQHIPHVARFMVDELDDLLTHAETIVVGNHDARYTAAVRGLANGQVVVDLVGVRDQPTNGRSYRGICW